MMIHSSSIIAAAAAAVCVCVWGGRGLVKKKFILTFYTLIPIHTLCNKMVNITTNNNCQVIFFFFLPTEFFKDMKLDL